MVISIKVLLFSAAAVNTAAIILVMVYSVSVETAVQAFSLLTTCCLLVDHLKEAKCQSFEDFRVSESIG